MPAKSDLIRLRHMLGAAEKALHFTRGKTRADLDRDEQLSLALVRILEIIDEAAAKDDLLMGLVGGQGGVCVNPTLQEFIRKHDLGIRYSDESTKRRTVHQLLRAAKDFDLSAKKVVPKKTAKRHA